MLQLGVQKPAVRKEISTLYKEIYFIFAYNKYMKTNLIWKMYTQFLKSIELSQGKVLVIKKVPNAKIILG